MKVAIFGDVHGNSIALDAVLEDIEKQGGVDAYWLLGDYAAIGVDPVGCIQRIAKLPNTEFIRGNTDRIAREDLALSPPFFDAVENEDAAGVIKWAQAHVTFSWTLGAVQEAGLADWLRALPLEYRTTLPDGTKVLLVHASPGTDEGEGLHPHQSDEELEKLFAGDDADLIFVGHTHVAVDKQIAGKRLINASSVSNPFPPDLDANYLILEADETGHSIERHNVTYDREAVIRKAEELKHPGREYIIGFMRGTNQAHWMR